MSNYATSATLGLVVQYAAVLTAIWFIMQGAISIGIMLTMVQTVILYYQPTVFLIIILGSALVFLIPTLMSKKLQEKQLALSEKSENLTESVTDILNGFATVKATQTLPVGKIMYGIREKTMARITANQVSEFGQNKVSSYTSNLLNDVELIEINLIEPFFDLISQIIVVIISSASILIVSLTSALYALASVVSAAYYGYIVERSHHKDTTLFFMMIVAGITVVLLRYVFDVINQTLMVKFLMSRID
ncbi:hypothetical protein GQS40_08320|uniref:ABC transmembrane type-1 domain-containing protein n=1 Tax=Leuconostoc lactis TaxID=1246 RepID=A0A6L7A741_LEULA|nr:hypothetical protein [Leuconostoc lactis]